MDATVKRTLEAAIKAMDAENTRQTFAGKNADYKAGYNDAINSLRYIADTLEDEDGSDERKRNEGSREHLAVDQGTENLDGTGGGFTEGDREIT